MADGYFTLSDNDKSDALGVAAAASGRPAELLEKDIWVVLVLEGLFSAAFGNHLTFKGGTSLSKAYRIIRRFSEDVDVTYDIRALLPSETKDSDARPASRSQAEKWSKAVRASLPRWIADTALAALQAHLTVVGPDADLDLQGDCLHVRYRRVAPSILAYVLPTVRIEFGARSTGEPSQIMPVTCDAAAHVSGIVFPTAAPRVMKAERTFWEKATAAHVYCRSGRMSSERYARHWYDLVQLDKRGVATSALNDPELAAEVAQHKDRFFPAKDREGKPIQYESAIAGSLQLVPEGGARTQLEEDYERMVEAGLLEEEAPTFTAMMDDCGRLQARANSDFSPNAR